MSKHRPDPARLGAYLAGDLAAARRRDVEVHLAECAACTVALRRMRNARRLLVEDVPPGAPGAPDFADEGRPLRDAAEWRDSWQTVPPRLRDAIDKVVRGEEEPVRRPWLWWVLAPAAAVAAALVVAWLGGFFAEAGPDVTVAAPVARSGDVVPVGVPGAKVAGIVTLRAGPEAHVALGPDRDAAWRVLKLDETIPEGARLRTVAGARLGVQLGGTSLALAGDAELELRLAETTRTELFLTRGMILVHGQHLKVGTLDHDVVAIAAAGFAVTRGAEATVVDVYEGAVAVYAAAHPDVFVTLTAPAHAELPHHPDLSRAVVAKLGPEELAALGALGSVPVYGGDVAADFLGKTGLVMATAGEAGAEVRVDGTSYGQTDMLLRLTLGVHKVGFWRSGYETHSEDVNVVPGPVPQKVDEKPVVDTRAAVRRAVVDTVRGYLPRVKGCYERVLKHDPEAEGKVVVRFVVKPDGAVASADMTSDTMAYPAVSECVVGEVRTWSFPPPSDGKAITVSYPFVFTSAELDAPK